MSIHLRAKRRKAGSAPSRSRRSIAGGAARDGVARPSPPAYAAGADRSSRRSRRCPSFADVVEQVKPAVVSVRVKTRQVADRGR